MLRQRHPGPGATASTPAIQPHLWGDVAPFVLGESLPATRTLSLPRSDQVEAMQRAMLLSVGRTRCRDQ
jgi:hypothetical protein